MPPGGLLIPGAFVDLPALSAGESTNGGELGRMSLRRGAWGWTAGERSLNVQVALRERVGADHHARHDE